MHRLKKGIWEEFTVQGPIGKPGDEVWMAEALTPFSYAGCYQKAGPTLEFSEDCDFSFPAET